MFKCCLAIVVIFLVIALVLPLVLAIARGIIFVLSLLALLAFIWVCLKWLDKRFMPPIK